MTMFLGLSGVAVAGGSFVKDVEPVIEPVIDIQDGSMLTDSGFYLGAGISAASTRDASLDFFEKDPQQDRTAEILVLAGYDFNKYIGIEGRFYKSIAKEGIIDRSSWALLAKPHVPINDNVTLYALAGYGSFKGESIDGSNVDIDDSGLQLGVGASYKVTDNISLFADWLSIVYDETQDSFVTTPNVVSMDAFTFGVTYRF